MSYASVSTLHTRLGMTVATDDLLLNAYLDAAQKAIEGPGEGCNRCFEARMATRYYRENDLDNEGRLFLGEDLLAVTTLTNANGQEIPVAGYWLEPRNKPQGQDSYDYIRLKSSYVWIFPVDGEISVAGTWGYTTNAPANISEATLQLAAYLYRLKDSGVYDVTADPMSGTLTIPKGWPKTVKLLIQGYRRLV